MIYFVVYLIETIWVVKNGMLINKGSKAIMSLTFFHLTVKLIAYWWSVYLDIWEKPKTYEKYLYEVADFSNFLVYLCTFFFIFTLWKSYTYLSNQEAFNRNIKYTNIAFFTTMILYFIQSVIAFIFFIIFFVNST